MRHTFPREFYLPKNETLTPIDCSGIDASVYTYEKIGPNGQTRYFAIAFHGKSQKPDFNFYYTKPESRAKKIAEYLDGRKSRAEMMSELKTKRQTPHTLKVGNILVCSWGYDQTNIDYYQVTRVPGPMSVEIRAIAAHSTGENGFMTADCTAVRDAFKGDPMIKRANSYNSVRIASYASAFLWDGKPDRYSWYA